MGATNRKYGILYVSMFSFSRNKKKKKTELGIVYDIGSASVGGALVLFVSGKKSKIIYSVRHDMVFQKEFDIVRMEKSMYKALASVSEDLVKNGIPHLRFTEFGSLRPERAFCTLASPWLVSQTRTIHTTFDRPRKIRQRDIIERVEQEREVFLESDDVIDLIGENDHILIEEKVVRVLLNGYEISHFGAGDARSMDISAIFSVAPTNIIQGISDAIQRIFPSCATTYHSFPSVLFGVLRDTLEGKIRDFVMIDISGEVTDVSVIDDMNLIETVTFPVGKKTILRSVAESAGMGTEESLSYLQLSNEGAITGRAKEKIMTALKTARALWYRSYEHALKDLADTHLLSHAVFFTSDTDVKEWFSHVIDDAVMSRFGALQDTSAVHAVDITYMKEWCTLAEDVEPDTFLMAGAVCMQKMSENA